VTLVWSRAAWEDYLYWQATDRKIVKRIDALIKNVALLKDIARTGAASSPQAGLGKPEALKHGFQGYWSRRITDEHRLIYKLAGDEIRIAQCRYHYAP
jgi:toxin YoeB